MQVKLVARSECGPPQTLIVEHAGKYDLIFTLESGEQLRMDGIELWRAVVALMADEEIHGLSKSFVCF